MFFVTGWNFIKVAPHLTVGRKALREAVEVAGVVIGRVLRS